VSGTFLLGLAAAVLVIALLSFLLAGREPWDIEETPERFRRLQRAYDRCLRALKDLEFDHQAGTLSADEHGRLKAEYKGRAISIRRALERQRLAAVRRIAAGESTAPTRSEREEIEALVARARAAQK